MHLAVWRKAARAGLVCGLACALLGALAPAGRADEQRVKRLSVAIYAMPTSFALGDFNKQIQVLNQGSQAFGLAPIGKIHAGAVFGAEGKYFASRHIAISVGVGKIARTSKLDLTPQVGSHVIVLGRVLAVPRTLGADYYFEPYTRGDFTLRPFVGGGMMDLVSTKIKIGAAFTSPDTTFDFFSRLKGDGSGFYVESGIHLMFPSRYSVLLNLNYRNARVRRMYDERTHVLAYGANGKPYSLDLSGVGLRFGIGINLRGKPPE